MAAAMVVLPAPVGLVASVVDRRVEAVVAILRQKMMV
jgi:hypothetical protein